MKIGQIYLNSSSSSGARRFFSIVDGLNRLTVDQHVLVADPDLARGLRVLPFVTVGPTVRSPVMAYCLMPAVDVVHVYDDHGGQAALLLTLTRSEPFVITEGAISPTTGSPLNKSVLRRSHAIVEPEQLDSERLVELYREAAGTALKLPQNADCR